MEEIEMKKQTVEIEGPRSLYMYTFTSDGQTMPPMKEEDVQPLPSVVEEK